MRTNKSNTGITSAEKGSFPPTHPVSAPCPAPAFQTAASTLQYASAVASARTLMRGAAVMIAVILSGGPDWVSPGTRAVEAGGLTHAGGPDDGADSGDGVGAVGGARAGRHHPRRRPRPLLDRRRHAGTPLSWDVSLRGDSGSSLPVDRSFLLLHPQAMLSDHRCRCCY